MPPKVRLAASITNAWEVFIKWLLICEVDCGHHLVGPVLEFYVCVSVWMGEALGQMCRPTVPSSYCIVLVLDTHLQWCPLLTGCTVIFSFLSYRTWFLHDVISKCQGSRGSCEPIFSGAHLIYVQEEWLHCRELALANSPAYTCTYQTLKKDDTGSLEEIQTSYGGAQLFEAQIEYRYTIISFTQLCVRCSPLHLFGTLNCTIGIFGVLTVRKKRRESYYCCIVCISFFCLCMMSHVK